MYFSEFVRSTLIDFPPYSSLMVFVPGCNLRCPFCYNVDIVLDQTKTRYSEEQILYEIDSYRMFLDAVVISGGEPTLKQDELLHFLKEVRNRGLFLKLDSNLTVPLKESFIQFFHGVTFSPKPYSFYRRVGDPGEVVEVIKQNLKLIDSYGLQYREVKLVLTKEGKRELNNVMEELQTPIITSQIKWKLTRLPAVYIDENSHFGHFTPDSED